MKFLVFGAGVLGCNIARNLFRAGKDVTLLARGNWAKEIKKNGLRIKDKFSLRMSVSRIPIVTELKPEDKYDVIFVAMRYTQIDSVMDTLRASFAKICRQQCTGKSNCGFIAGEKCSVCFCTFCRTS